jgi:putative transposase
LAAENSILTSQIKRRLRFPMARGANWAGIANRLGRKALQKKSPASPNRIRSLAWYRKLVAQKFDGSNKRELASPPRVDATIEELVETLARENSSWGYDRIVGA